MNTYIRQHVNLHVLVTSVVIRVSQTLLHYVTRSYITIFTKPHSLTSPWNKQRHNRFLQDSSLYDVNCDNPFN